MHVCKIFNKILSLFKKYKLKIWTNMIIIKQLTYKTGQIKKKSRRVQKRFNNFSYNSEYNQNIFNNLN